jgi:hypothetical protein
MPYPLNSGPISAEAARSASTSTRATKNDDSGSHFHSKHRIAGMTLRIDAYVAIIGLVPISLSFAASMLLQEEM